jgi:hypothetical protein
MNITLGIIGLVLSLLLIIYRAQVKSFTGAIVWAERTFGMGGTYTFFLIVGVLGILFSLMLMTGTFDILFQGVFGNFFGSVK